jgi:hypothetical protein
LTGGVTSVGNAATVVTNANLTGVITSVGNTTSWLSSTGSGANVLATSPTLVTPALGTPSALVGTNITGTATAFTASNVTTNANLTGDVTSVGNATTVVKINGTTMSALATGILKNTTTTGVPSIAVAADFPTLNQNTTGTAASATGSAATFTSTTQNSQFNSIGVGTAGSAVAGEIRATNNITAYYSDDRFKTNLGNIPDSLAKVMALNGFYYEANELAQSYGYEKKSEIGVSAQQVQAILPEVVAPAPIDENYLTVRYERLVPLLIEAIKELNTKVDALTQTVTELNKGI